MIVVILVLRDDPILLLGTDPVNDTVNDASIAHEHYLPHLKQQ